MYLLAMAKKRCWKLFKLLEDYGVKNCPWTDRKDWDIGKRGRGEAAWSEMIGFYFFCVLVLLKETDLFMLGVKNDTHLIFFFCWTSSWLMTSRCWSWDLGIQSWHCSVWLENASVMTPLVAKNAALYKLSLFLSSSLLLLATKVKSEKPARWDWLSIG